MEDKATFKNPLKSQLVWLICWLDFRIPRHLLAYELSVLFSMADSLWEEGNMSVGEGVSEIAPSSLYSLVRAKQATKETLKLLWLYLSSTTKSNDSVFIFSSNMALHSVVAPMFSGLMFPMFSGLNKLQYFCIPDQHFEELSNHFRICHTPYSNLSVVPSL